MMESGLRRYTFKLYPNAGQAVALDAHRRMHCALYNALLQQRIEAYRRQSRTLSYYDQCKELTALRNDADIGAEWAALSSDAMAATAQRVDRAMQAFFRRAKEGAGAQAGFPRFKRSDDYPGFSFKKHGSGWNLKWRDAGNRPSCGSLYFKAVPGRVKFRGRLPAKPEQIKTCELLWRGGDWWLSLVVEMAPHRPLANEKGEVAFNLVDHFARVKSANGGHPAGPDGMIYVMRDGRISLLDHGANGTSVPAALETGTNGGGVGRHQPSSAVPAAPEIGTLQQAMARCKRGSNRYRKLKRLKARKEARVARRRREALHEWTTELSRQFGELRIVKPASIKEATKSGKGSEREWGAAVQTKATINRAMLDQAPALAVQMLEYKLAEAGGHTEVVADDNPPVDAGMSLVLLAKAARRTRRTLKREKELLNG